MTREPQAASAPTSDVSSGSTDFEKALSELETLVERLERGDLPLEDALRTFERGVELTRHCQTSLKAAQQKVEILLKRNGQSGMESGLIAPFNAPDEGAAASGQE